MYPAKTARNSVLDSQLPDAARNRLRRVFRAALACLLLSASPALAVERPNVLLITLDTTRADHLGLYGYERDTSPNLDALAEDSIVYTRAFSTSSWTLPAHASLFTGLFPTSHGARYDEQGSLVLDEGIRGKDLTRYRAAPLASDVPVLAELLREAGYATGGIVAGPWMKQVFGLARGFDAYDDSSIDNVHGRLAVDVTEKANAWVDSRASAPGGKPFFLFLNYYDPHGPYTDPAGHARKFLPPNTVVFPQPREKTPEFLSGVYDGEIRYMDDHLGELFAHLKSLGLYDSMLIIVTADHGELLGEHDRKGHGSSLYQEELHIPLLVKYPKAEREPSRNNEIVQLTDLLPLLLKRLGISAPSGLSTASKSGPDRRAYAEVYPLMGPDPVVDWRVSVEGPFKYVWTSGGERHLFNLEEDPGELVDLAPEEAERLRDMATWQEQFVAGLPVAERKAEPGPEIAIDEETRRALEGLGYLE